MQLPNKVLISNLTYPPIGSNHFSPSTALLMEKETVVHNKKFIYYTTFGDWLDEKDFILIKKASKKTYKQLIKELKKEKYDEE